MKVVALFLVCFGAAFALEYYEKSCEGPADPGMCQAYIPMYYYDKITRTCEKFIYGGCQGNGNRYRTREECLENCAGSRKPQGHSCNLDADAGPCDAYIPSYYYNSKTRRCEKFIYGGCSGNSNRFSTEDECYNACGGGIRPPKVDVCSLDAEPGPCRAYVPSYFYNYRTGKCEKFVYGGCGGNENRFATQEDCYAKCGLNLRPETDDVCSLDSDSGPCYGNFPMYYYNSRTRECERFIYGGCQGNANRFRTKEECYGKCGTRPPYSAPNAGFCTLKPETGPCKAAFRKYYYNAETGTCERFTYGGCAGNENRFDTKAQCYSACASEKSCKGPADPGMCLAYIPMYYYNEESGTCEKFIYGGCQGNGNRYKTKEECLENCARKSEEDDVCTLKPETGRCLAYIVKYFYNSETGECKQFVYGGCGGNGNKFDTKEECYSKCSPRSKADEDTCSLEAETGMCKGYFPRYYFNKNSGTCEEFVYGGCGGNSNNFRTYEECADACGAP